MRFFCIRNQPTGFTLIELMVVVAIIGILASIALPAYEPYIVRSQITEALNLPDVVKIKTIEYYKARGVFPKNNREAAVPEPEKLIGNYVKRIVVEGGAIHVELGNKINSQLKGKFITFRPIVVIDSPESPVSWVCGYSLAPEGMRVVGKNNTDIDPKYLPSACRI